MIGDEDLVGQIEDQVTLIVGARQAQLHRLELEDQIISKGAVEAEMLILGAAEQMDQRPQYREERGLSATALLGETLAGFANLAGDPVLADLLHRGRGQTNESFTDRSNEDPPALVQ